jgi:hypothetical protein
MVSDAEEYKEILTTCQAQTTDFFMPADVPGILQRLHQVTGVRTDAELARYLEITPQSIISAKRTGRIPRRWFYKVGYEKDIRIEWLETGEEPMYRPLGPTLAALPADVQAHLARWQSLQEHMQALSDTCERLLAEADMDIREWLRDQIHHAKHPQR